MLNIGNKKYRNLQEQVGYNTECIKKLSEAIDGLDVVDKLVVIESDSGTFTDKELVVLSGPLAFISNGSRVWMKDSETLVEFVYKAIDIKADEVGGAYFNIGGSKIVVSREDGSYNISSDTIITTYNKTQIDSIINNIMAIKADKTELALKADISGQAFTGPITAPSIIQNMVGFSMTSLSITNLSITNVYGGACQNGNKLTLVYACNLIRTDTIASSPANPSLIKFNIPSNIGAKVFPAIGTLTVEKQINLFTDKTSTSGDKQLVWALFKYSNTDLEIICNYAQLNQLIQDHEYYVRFEVTLLLSDSLV